MIAPFRPHARGGAVERAKVCRTVSGALKPGSVTLPGTIKLRSAMKDYLRRGMTAVAAVVLAAAGLLVTASPAQAATITGVSYSTTAPVVDGDSWCGDRTKITVTVSGAIYGSVTAEAFNYTTGDSVSFEILAGSGSTHTGWLNFCGWDTPGAHRVQVEAWDDNGLIVHTSYIWLRRPVSLTYNASPEPVRRGALLTHSGRLMFDPYAPGAMFGAANQKVQIAFRANGSSTYVSKGTVTTGSGGYYSKRITATGSGTWRAVYAGDAAHASQTKWDAVTAN